MKSIFKKLFAPSTLAFWKERKTGTDTTVAEWLHGYLYFKYPYLYIPVAKGDHPMSRLFDPLVWLVTRFLPTDNDPDRKTFADSYHGKAMPLKEAVKLVQVNREVKLSLPEQVLPYKSARDLILKEPQRIALIDCPCRVHAKNHCQPLDVCLIVGEPFVSFMLEHHPETSRLISSEEAVRVLKETDARGNVHHAFFKDGMVNRFYAICNCCSCCCGAMLAHREGMNMLCSSGYVAQVDAERCVGCGNCTQYCQFDALSVRDRELIIDRDQCMGCAVCESKCPKQALSLVLAPDKGMPLEMDKVLGGAFATHMDAHMDPNMGTGPGTDGATDRDNPHTK